MADDKKKHSGEPAVEFRWDPLVLAHNKTFSTTIRIEVSGWWEEGRPREVAVSHYEAGEEPTLGNAVRIQKGHGTFPLTGLKPGHHYHVVCYIEDRTPVHNMITVPDLPKPPKPEVEALERERTELERSRVASEKKKLETQEKKLFPTDFTVEKAGNNGKYKLVISVFSKEKPESVGIGIPEVTVTTFDKYTGQSWETKTGPGGVAIFEVPEFEEREKIFTVVAEGVSFVKDRQLLGPRTPARP